MRIGNNLGTKILITLIIMFMLITPVFAEEKVQITYYGVDTCINCKEVEAYFENTIFPNYSDKAEITKKNLANKAEEEEFIIVTSKFNAETVVPTIVVNNRIYQGADEIKGNLENEILTGEPSTEETVIGQVEDIQNEKFGKFSLAVILVASLIDGVNPCAIAMLLFFMSLLIALNDKKKILLAGLSYCSAIFLTYLGIGIGLLEFVKYFSGLNYVLFAIYIITIIICITLIIIDTKDYIALKRGNLENVKNELPKGIKHKIHTLLRKQAASKWIVVTTFLTGIAVALLEFSCTGQVYIPTITFILSQGNALALFYLIIYNIGFIMPILAITIIVYKSKSIMTVSNLLVTKRKYIKLISIIFYTGILVYFIVKLTRLI